MTRAFIFQRLPVLLILLVFCCLQDIQANIILSDIPKSINVSVGTLVEFTCATPETGLTVFTLAPGITLGNTMSTEVMLPNGDRKLMLSFIAPSEYQMITISCVATRVNNMGMLVDINQSTAVLMIQGRLAAVGNLTSEVDHCKSIWNIIWTAPYTLQGVPINYYTINITRHSDGAVLRSDTTNTTEYLYTVSSLGETLEVVVAAVNGAGTGNMSSVQTNSNFFLDLKIVERNRSGTSWTYVLTVTKGEEVICPGGIAIVKFQDKHSGVVYDTSANFMQLSNGDMCIVANFSNLTENTLYQPSISVFNNNGTMLKESSHVDITQVDASTFDISEVDYTIHPGVINITTVQYVHKCEFPHQFYVELQCKSRTIAKLFNGSSGSINNVPSNEQCALLVTDGDAMNSINETTPFNETVMTLTIVDDITSSPTTPSPNPSIEPTNTGQLTVIGVVTGGGVVIAVVIVLGIVIITLHKKKRCSVKCNAEVQNIKVSRPHIPNVDITQTSRSNGPAIERRQPEHEEVVYTEAAFNRNAQPAVDLEVNVVYSDVLHQQ